jgi:hypothetical protein
VHAEFPGVELKVPAAQSVALLLPVPLSYEPAGARVHAAAPVLELKAPAAQGVALLLPVPES